LVVDGLIVTKKTSVFTVTAQDKNGWMKFDRNRSKSGEPFFGNSPLAESTCYGGETKPQSSQKDN
jgi:hypothetical protein